MAGNNDVRYLKHGKIVDLPTEKLFCNPFYLDLSGLGKMDL
jgi:hypothetical protein